MIEINSASITIKGSGIVTSKTTIEVLGTNTNLEITHTADFSKIPIEFHKIYFDSFKASLIDSKVYDNTQTYYPMSIKEKQTNFRLSRILDIFKNTNK